MTVKQRKTVAILFLVYGILIFTDTWLGLIAGAGHLLSLNGGLQLIYALLLPGSALAFFRCVRRDGISDKQRRWALTGLLATGLFSSVLFEEPLAGFYFYLLETLFRADFYTAYAGGFFHLVHGISFVARYTLISLAVLELASSGQKARRTRAAVMLAVFFGAETTVRFLVNMAEAYRSGAGEQLVVSFLLGIGGTLLFLTLVWLRHHKAKGISLAATALLALFSAATVVWEGVYVYQLTRMPQHLGITLFEAVLPDEVFNGGLLFSAGCVLMLIEIARSLKQKGCYKMRTRQLHMGHAVMKTAPAAVLRVYQLTGSEKQEARAAVALQGIVNRYGASLYICHPLHGEMDELWLQELPAYYKRIERVGSREQPTGFYQLFEDHQEYVERLVVFDPDSDHQWNIATTMAAVSDSLPVTPEIAQRLQENGWSGAVEDIRDRWPDKTAAYDWAVAELLPQCADFGVLSQDARGEHRFHDYGIACGLFCFWLDLTDPVDLAIQKKIFHSGHFAPQPTVFGYAPQGDDLLEEGAPAGFGFIVSDWFGNASVCASLPTVEMPMQRPGVPVKAEDGKLYVSLFFSDGDNIQFDQLGTRALWNSMQSTRRTVPVGTTFAAVTVELAPHIIRWYYEHMDPAYDELMAGPSGWQFIYYGKYNRDFLEGWLAKNDHFLRKAGIRVANPWRFYPVEQREDVAQYMTRTTGIDGSFCEGIQPDSCNAYMVGGKPVLLAQGNLNAKNPDDLELFLSTLYRKVEASGGKPQFASVNMIVAWMDSDYRYLQEQVDRLKPELKDKVVFLRPSDLIATFRAYAAEHQLEEHV